ncbi:MAG: OFA family MFS transporter [Lentisphaerae bacterium]|nr:OFA family MFS transporter [Lentisphaerota bacterium]
MTKKYRVLAASVLLHACLGGVYAWSTFVPELHDTWGLSMTRTQVLFGGLIATLTLVMVPAGRLVSRLGPRPVAALGGLLFAAGYLLAAASGGRFGLLFAGISLLAGAGTGCCYVCPLVAGVAWFPERKGLITGLAVAGFGGGAVVLTLLGEWLLRVREVDVLRVFGIIGWLYGGVIIAAALLLTLPDGPPPVSPRAAIPRPGGLGRDRFFHGLFLGMFAGTFAGLLVIGNLKPLALLAGLSEAVAVEAIAAFSFGNAAGRVVWGWLADRLGGRTPWLSLAILAAATLALLAARPHAVAFLAAATVAGAGFGACFVVYATLIAGHYGAARLAEIYPLVFLAYGLSGALGPATGGLLFELTGGYGLALGLCVLLLAAAALALRRLQSVADSSGASRRHVASCRAPSSAPPRAPPAAGLAGSARRGLPHVTLPWLTLSAARCAAAARMAGAAPARMAADAVAHSRRDPVTLTPTRRSPRPCR